MTTVPNIQYQNWERRLLNRATLDSCSNGMSKVELQFNTAQLVIKVQISSIVLVLSQKKINFILPKSTIINCHSKLHKEMMFYQSSTTIYPGQTHFFWLRHYGTHSALQSSPLTARLMYKQCRSASNHCQNQNLIR